MASIVQYTSSIIDLWINLEARQIRLQHGHCSKSQRKYLAESIDSLCDQIMAYYYNA